jgi:glutaminyl-tRNA synthetase
VDPGRTYLDNLNPNSLQVIDKAQLEPSVSSARVSDRFQFERLGYFCVDSDSQPNALVFNRTVQLRDTWAKIAKKDV